jgi:general secretion pathway protein G
MERIMPSGSLPRRSMLRRGFTLIEMMIVMAIIVILIALAVPFYQKAIIRAKETVLHNNIRAIRSSIDEYAFDKQKAPASLQDLVSAGYLHDVPNDPIAQTREWNIIMEDAGQAVNSSEPGIYDIRSKSDKTSPLDGTRYSEW